jgi:hypothetical protein
MRRVRYLGEHTFIAAHLCVSYQLNRPHVLVSRSNKVEDPSPRLGSLGTPITGTISRSSMSNNALTRTACPSDPKD